MQLALTLAATLLLLACPAGAQSRAPVASLQELRSQGVVIQKWDISCGAAALATLLTFQHGDPVPEKTIAEAMLGRTTPLRVRTRGGFSLLDLKRYADSRGYEGNGYSEVTLESLSGLAPAIVPIQTNGYNHFVVFKGIRTGHVLLADPAFGNRSMSVERFEGEWVGKLAFTVERRGGGVAPPGRLAPDERQIVVPPATQVRRSLR